MSYPRVEIDLEKIEHNTKHLVDLCSKYNIDVAGVTKVFCAFPEVVEAMIKGGIAYIADSRIENLKKLKDFSHPKLLLRLPMLSQANEVIQYSDISLNSEIMTIKELSKYAIKKGIKHNIILMIDLGDLREGIWEQDEIFATVENILSMEGINLIGIGTNLTCFGGIIPDDNNLGKLISMKQLIEARYNVHINIVSGGNSSSLYLLENNTMPKGINQLRLGESIVLGRETAYGELINHLYDDAFIVKCEIIEIKEKPSVPEGNIGMDAFGNKPNFIDKGIRKRAICAIGKQDVDLNDILPEDTDIIILGGSSDHVILDVTESNESYSVGSVLSFKLNYGGILRIMTSPYIKKHII